MRHRGAITDLAPGAHPPNEHWYVWQNIGDLLGQAMPTERDRMLAGELYDPLDSDLVARRVRARDLCHALNATREAETDQRRAILR